MAKKNSTKTKIWVKKPKIGETYFFLFAGGIMKGVLDEPNEKLTAHYNTKWFWIKSGSGSSEMRYPVSIHSISENYNDLKPSN